MVVKPGTKIARILLLLALIVGAAYQLLADYYALDRRLVQPSPQGYLALIYYELGRYGDAARAWRQHYGLAYDSTLIRQLEEQATARIHAHPDRLDNYLQLADLHVAAGDYSHAAEVYRQALSHTADPDPRIGLAAALAALGQHAESQALWEDVFDQDWRERDLSIFLGVLSGLDALERSRAPQTAAARLLTLSYMHRYLAILDKRQLDRVIAYADRALALDPSLAGGHVAKAVVYGKREELERALEEFGKAVALRSTGALYHRMANVSGAMGRLEEELAFHRQAVRAAPANPKYAYALGEILLRKYGDLSEAIISLRSAHELAPTQYAFAVMYGYALEQARRDTEALDVYGDVLRRWPDVAEAYTLKARCLITLGRYHDAVELLHAASERAPHDFETSRELGYAYAKLKDPERAIAAYRRALDLKPYDVDTLYGLQTLYRMRGRYAEAHEAVRTILRLDPNHSGAKRLLPYLRLNAGV